MQAFVDIRVKAPGVPVNVPLPGPREQA